MTKTLVILSMMFVSFSVFAVLDPVVATVNGQQIKLSFFEQTYKQNLLFVSNKKVTKTKVLNDLINREIGIQNAKKIKLDQDPTVKEKMEDVLYHALVSKDLEPRLMKINVTDDQVRDYYLKNKEYRTAHILFRMRAEPTKEESEAALSKALEVYAEIQKKPSKFAELANKYSQSNTAPNGGDLGFQPAMRLAPEYFDAINGKPVNFVTQPVKTQFGYHIVKVVAVKDYKEIDMPLYKKIIYDIARDKIIDEYFAEQRKNSTIKIEKKYLE